MSGNVWKSISRHFQTHLVPGEYSKKFLRGFGSITLPELSKNDSETGGEAIPTDGKIFLSILPRQGLGADFQTFPDISRHPTPCFAPQGISRHLQTHSDSTVIKRRTSAFQRIQPFKKRSSRRRERVRSVRIPESGLNRPDIDVLRAQKLPLTFFDDL